MKLEYKLKKDGKLTDDVIQACDEGAKATQDVLFMTAKLTMKRSQIALVWFLTRFYRRRITDEAITYNFYLLP